MFDKGIFKLRSHQNWEQSRPIAQNLVEEKKTYFRSKKQTFFYRTKTICGSIQLKCMSMVTQPYN